MEISLELLENIKRLWLIFLIIFIDSSVSDSSNLKYISSNAENFRNVEVLEHRVKREDESCYPPVNCADIPNVDIYRTATGICNNLENPYWGASFIPFIRNLPRDPPGDDFRCESCPKPRVVSSTINAALPHGAKDGITVMVMQWGQLVDHDLLFASEDEDVSCCQDFRTPEPTSDSCFPIDVTDDSFYSTIDPPVTCLPFVRSKAAPCAGPDRTTTNERTAYLDASPVYGSTEEQMYNLREFSEGKLKIGNQNEPGNCSLEYNVCPRTSLPSKISRIGVDDIEFFAGDHRREHQPALTSLHTLLLRLHNELADKLDCGDDETTFQTARKLVGALTQLITYYEFLPIVLGPNIMNEYQLTLNPATCPFNLKSDYDVNMSASAPIDIDTAFRFGHSLIPNEFRLNNVTVKLAEVFENHYATLRAHSHPSQFIHSVIRQDAEPMDHVLVDALTNKLLALHPFTFGSDLYARNIKRGRDHGLPAYIHWFNRCANKHHKPTIESFDDLYSYMPSSVVDEFKDIYLNMEDIDLFPAGIAEFEVPGGLVGPTFACIIAEHFHHIKYGDRFWFENPGFFTLEQIQSIRETKLASIVCLFTSVESSQENVMQKVDQNKNPEKMCSEILKKGVLKDIGKPIWMWKNIC